MEQIILEEGFRQTNLEIKDYVMNWSINGRFNESLFDKIIEKKNTFVFKQDTHSDLKIIYNRKKDFIKLIQDNQEIFIDEEKVDDLISSLIEYKNKQYPKP